VADAPPDVKIAKPREHMIQDASLTKAVAGIPQRSEKQGDIQKLVGAFVRYNIYTLDYGTYVDLLNTSRKPDLGFDQNTEGSEEAYVVPFDDKRSIRRIILTADFLSQAQPATAFLPGMEK
jgi:hypothetical protein